MLKFLPIVLLSIAQNIHPLYSNYLKYMPIYVKRIDCFRVYLACHQLAYYAFKIAHYAFEQCFPIMPQLCSISHLLLSESISNKVRASNLIINT